MTKPNEPIDPEDMRGLLWERLQRISADQVGEASKKVARYSVEDDDDDKRKSKADVRRTLHKIRQRFFQFLFFMMCAVVSVCAVGYLYLVWLWISTLVYGTKVHDAAALKSFIDSVLWSLLIIFATLFLEGTFKDEKD